MSRTLLLSLLLSALLATACAPLYSVNAASKWPALGHDYLRSLRWGDHAAIVASSAPEGREALLARSDEFKALSVADAQLESYRVAPDQRHAETVIVLDYYRLPSARVQRVTLRQQWEYRQEGSTVPGIWCVVTPLPVFP